MTATMHSLGIDRLPVEERLALVREIWDSIVGQTPSNLSDAQREDLRRRAAEDDASPGDTVSWEEAVAAALRGAGA